MKLPNGDEAIISDQKLLGYLLNPSHEEGKDHARLFDLLLGINLTNAHLLRAELLVAAREADASFGKSSRYGKKYEVRFQMTGKRGCYTILSVWIVPADDPVPRLVTAYIE